MYLANINFTEIPEIGFAHKYLSYEYKYDCGYNDAKKIEIAYVESGCLMIEFNNEKVYAPSGSIVVLFRQLPLIVSTVGKGIQSHYTVLAEFSDYSCKLFNSSNYDDKFCGFSIPFVTEHANGTDVIANEIKNIVIENSMSKDRPLEQSVRFLSILYKIDNINRKVNECNTCGQILVNNVLEYV